MSPDKAGSDDVNSGAVCDAVGERSRNSEFISFADQNNLALATEMLYFQGSISEHENNPISARFREKSGDMAGLSSRQQIAAVS